MQIPRLTILGRTVLLITAEILANIACWAATGIVFSKHPALLGLALLAWTTGLRHALDADHISAIDNATRNLIAQDQLPVTCGLFFSLGHSTIVIAVNVAIAISTSVYDQLGGVGTVGAIVGPAISGSFLALVGIVNTIILWKIIKKRQRTKRGIIEDQLNQGMLMTRILGPLLLFVNKPWKMYPVGVLFGLGLDTASSIALLAISALAERDANGHGIQPGEIVILPFLFTVGMTFIDSLDSILMLYSYSGFSAKSWVLIEKRTISQPVPQDSVIVSNDAADHEKIKGAKDDSNIPNQDVEAHNSVDPKQEDDRLRIKQNDMSNLSIVLTVLSILIAFTYASSNLAIFSLPAMLKQGLFRISLITIMGLIGDNCMSCQEAADAPDGGGLSGSWWRTWSNANEDSGYIGAALVGTFIFIVVGWYAIRWFSSLVRTRSMRTETALEERSNDV